MEIPTDRRTTWVTTSYMPDHPGGEIFWSEKVRKWILVDLLKGHAWKSDRLVAYSSDEPADELTRTANARLMRERRYWLVMLSASQDPPSLDGSEIAWDSDCGVAPPEAAPPEAATLC